MKKILITCITLISVICAHAQTYDLAFGEEVSLEDAKVVADPAGNIFIAGNFVGILDIGGAIYESDFYRSVIVIKYDPAGVAEWAHMTNSDGPVFLNALKLDKSGGVVVSFLATGDVVFGDAYFGPVVLGDDIGGMVGFAGNGSVRYQQMSRGGIGYSNIKSVEVDKAGNKYLGLISDGIPTYDGIALSYPETYSVSNGAIIKTNKTGDYIWSKLILASQTVTLWDIAVDKNGFTTVLGLFMDTIYIDDVELVADFTSYFLFRMDADGNVIWAKEMPYTSFFYQAQIEVDLTGNVYMTTIIGNITIDGNTFTSAVLGFDHESLIVKFNKNTGDMQWSQKLNTYGTAIANSMHFSRDGRLFIGGKYRSYMACDVMELTNDGDDADEAFVMEMDRDGNVIDLYDLNSGGVDDEIIDIAFDGIGNMYWVGNTSDELTLGTYTVGITAGAWVAKVHSGTYRESATLVSPTDIHVYPNPCNDVLVVSIGQEAIEKEIHIINSMGQVVMQMKTTDEDLHITTELLPEGMYYIQCGNISKAFEVVH